MFGGKKSLPATSSVLAPGPLLEAARQHYPIARDATCTLEAQGIHDTYAVSGEGSPYSLRVYRHGLRTEHDVQWELALVEHMAAQGAPVPLLMRTRSGNPYTIVLAPEGPRLVALFAASAGKPCDPGTITPVHARAYGRALAAVHLRMDTFETAGRRFELGFDHLLREPIQRLAPLMTHREHDLTYLRSLADDIREAVVDFDDRGLAHGLCYGNATPASARLDPHGEFTLFDFDAAGAGWRVYDIATFRCVMLRAADRKRSDVAYTAFLEGYREVRSLPKVDEEAVPPFVAAREIWDLGRVAQLTANQGTSILDDARIDAAINFLHDWYKEMMAYT